MIFITSSQGVKNTTLSRLFRCILRASRADSIGENPGVYFQKNCTSPPRSPPVVKITRTPTRTLYWHQKTFAFLSNQRAADLSVTFHVLLHAKNMKLKCMPCACCSCKGFLFLKSVNLGKKCKGNRWTFRRYTTFLIFPR